MWYVEAKFMKNRTKSIIIFISVLILISVFLFAVFKLEIITCEIAEIDDDYIYAKVPYPIKWYIDPYKDNVVITNTNGEIIEANELKIGDTIQVEKDSKKVECIVEQLDNNEIIVEIPRSMYYCLSRDKGLVLNKCGGIINFDELKLGDNIVVINIKDSFDDLLLSYYNDKKEPPDPLEYLNNVILVKVFK